MPAHATAGLPVLNFEHPSIQAQFLRDHCQRFHWCGIDAPPPPSCRLCVTGSIVGALIFVYQIKVLTRPAARQTSE